MKVDSDLRVIGYMDEGSGEDEEDFHLEDSNGTKAQLRKSNKPIMEKRRRARINNCLNELKGILLEAMRKDPARHSKLEKADILELTVRHLQNVQRNQLALAMATDPTVLHRFKNGFSECATEVTRYLSRLDGVEAGIKQRLTGHLGSCVNGLQQVGPPITYPSSTSRYSIHGFPIVSSVTPGDVMTSCLLSPVMGLCGGQDSNNNRHIPLNMTPSKPSTVTSSSHFDFNQRLNSAATTTGFTQTRDGARRPPTPPSSPHLPRLSKEENELSNVFCALRQESKRTSNSLVTGTALDFSVIRRKSQEESQNQKAMESGGDFMWRPW